MVDWRRHVMGVLGLLFLLGSVVLALSDVSGSTRQFALGAMVRSGMLLIVLWLALPSVIALYHYFPKWVWYVAIAALFAAVVQGKLLVIIGALFAVLVFFQIVSWFLSGLREK